MRTSTVPQNTLQKRIMGSLTPLITAFFVISALLAVIAVEMRGRANFDLRRNDMMDRLAESINGQFAIAIEDAERLAGNAFVREYFATVTDTTAAPEGRMTPEREAAQLLMLRSFNELIAHDPISYLGVRYLTNSNQIWGEITNVDGITDVNTIYKPRFDRANDSVYAQVLNLPLGQDVVLGPIVRLAATAERYIPIYIPIAVDRAEWGVRGIIQVDLALSHMFEEVSDLRDPQLGEINGRRGAVVDSQGNILRIIGTLHDSQWLNSLITQHPNDVKNIYVDGQIVSIREVISFSGISQTWRLVLIDDVLVGLAPTHLTALGILVGFVVAGFFVLRVINGLLGKALQPVHEAQSIVQQVASGNLTAPSEVVVLEDDIAEVGQLVNSIGSIAGQIRELNTQLDRQVRRRTRDIEVASKIGRETATLSRIDDLLNRAIDLICNELGFYHAQVFFVDDIRANAVLVYSHGEAGQKLLAKKHKLVIGSNTVIGSVTATATPVIINDTALPGQPFAFNALLPDTRAEMGLPLMIGGEVIGALDIQSREPNVFSDDDLPTFRLLSDQIAIAVNKARLVSQSEWRIQQIDTLNKQLTRMAWEETQETDQDELQYHYNLMEVLSRAELDQQNGAAHPGELAVPISIRGEVVGTINAQPMEGQAFTEGDEVVLRAVADRVALALENARLFQETQTSLAETSVLYQLSRYLSEASTLEDILNAIIVSVMNDAGGAQVWIFDEYEGASPDWMEIRADLAIAERDDVDGSLVGLRLRINDHPFMRRLHNNQVALVNDTRMDSRLDAGLQLLYRRMNARAVVAIPLNVRGAWLGVIMVEFEEARQFTEREGRIFSALIDQAGVAIDNRLLLERTEEAVALNENLYAASRIINTAQGPRDLVYAAAATTNDLNLDFALALVEGELDEGHWPTRCRIAARSRSGVVEALDIVSHMSIAPDSPIRQREPETIEDGVAANGKAASYVNWLEAELYPFVVIFPLFSASHPIALFFVMSHTVRSLSFEDNEAYRALTGQMSTVIENTRLLQRTETALDENRRLYLATRAIAAAQDSQAVYATTVEHLAYPLVEQANRVPQSFNIAIMLARPELRWDAPYLHCVYSWTNDPDNKWTLREGVQVDTLEAPFGQLALEREGAYYVPDVMQTDADLDNPTVDEAGVRAFLRQTGATSAIAIPIQSRQHWFGVLISQSTGRDAFNEQYTRFLEAAAGQLALAVENRKLFEEARVEAERAQMEARRAFALAEAAQFANQVGVDFDQSLGDVLQRVAEAGGYDRWQLALAAADGHLRTVFLHTADGINDLNNPIAAVDDLNPLTLAMQLRRRFVMNEIERFPAYQEFSPERKLQLRNLYGRSIVTPVYQDDRPIGALLMGRSIETDELDDADERLVATLTSQIELAFENRRLFRRAEAERQTLRSILSTLPAGVVVLDPNTLKPVQHNEQAEIFLGDAVLEARVFSAAAYDLYRTGTQLNYPDEELPIFIALQEGQMAFTDDVAVIRDGQQTDLLVNAAPITDEDGQITAIVTTFSDISNLRSLENTLQENLRETVAVYEAQRQLSEAGDLSEVLDVMVVQLGMLQPSDAYILLADEDTGTLTIERFLINPLEGVDLLTGIFDGSRAIYIRDVRRSTLDDETRSVLDTAGVRALFSVPLRSATRDLPMGWLLVTHETANGFTQEQERILTQFGDIAATAIENRYLIQSTRVALEETAALYTATTSISRARDFDQLVEALRLALTALDAEMHAAFLSQQANVMDELFSFGDYDTSLLRTALVRHELPEGGLYISNLQDLIEPSPLELDLQIAVGNELAALAVMPMRVKDGLGGRLVIGYTMPHHFTEGERRYMSTLSDSASVVLDNIVLVSEIQDTLEETTVLYQAGRSLNEAGTPQDILNIVVDYLIQSHVDKVFIAMLKASRWGDSHAIVEIEAGWSKDGTFDLQGKTLTPSQFPAWNQLASQMVLTVDNVETDKSQNFSVRDLEILDAQSFAVIPLRVPNRMIGAIWISSRVPHRHNDREQRIYQSFGEQASLSMEAAYLLSQTGYRARQLETSAQVSSTIGQILDLQELLPRLVTLIRDAFRYDHVQIFLMDADDDYAELRASTGEAGQQLLAIKHKLQKGSSSVIGAVTASGEPTIAFDTAEEGVVHKPNPYLPNTRSEMALPIIVKDHVIGALDVQSNQPNAFTEDDVRVLTTLAAQISVAIDNANLYAQSRTQADRMSLLFNITKDAAAAETLTDALQNVANTVQTTQRALTTTVYLKEESAPDRQNRGATYTILRAVALAGSNQPLSEIEVVRLDDTSRLLGAVAETQEPLIVPDLSQQPNYIPISLSARSAVIVPMLSAADLVGVIVMESGRLSAFATDTVQLIQTAASSLSAIVQSALLLDQLRQANDDLRELDRLKSDFLANMSHELRTPLNSIIGFSRVMLKGIDGPLTEMQEQDLTTIYNSGQHLLMLINDVLDQAKIAAGKMDLKFAYFDVKPMVEGVRSIGIGLIKDKPINLTVEMAPNLPKAYGDEFRTRQVLINLVSNAAKFTNEGAIVIRVLPMTHNDMTWVRVSVIDSGIGIAESDIPLLFEAFQQIDSSLTRTVGGTGLGLPIARSLIEMQGGTMQVESEVNVGSTFSIVIPTQPVVKEDSEESDAPPTVPLLTDQDTQPALETRTVPRTELPAAPPIKMPVKRQVLLIEDNPDMVDQFRRALQREGFEVLAATIPLEAEAMASGLRPTLIVMDVNFAKGAGWDILSRLKDRDDTFDIPIIVVTMSDDSERAYQVGAFKFIQRPFVPEDLVAAALEAEKESNTERILIIDDQPEAIRLLTQLLDEHGKYRVFSAQTGEDGIALVARRRPDLVILDLRMPGKDGFAVLNELRSNPETSAIPVMVITGEVNFNATEQQQLSNVRVLPKTDISEAQYNQFITGVQNHLNGHE